ncbi:selenium-dependent molybdenum cofactor biosynthesis protein YqeB [Thermodesulfobacteriota bacterium]
MKKQASEDFVCVRGGGDLATGVSWRLHRCGLRVLITEIHKPLAVRRSVAFCEAVYDGSSTVEGVEAVLINEPRNRFMIWEQGKIPLLIDPSCEKGKSLAPEILVDGIMAKKNLGTSVDDAPLVIALGPGFEAGRDAHFVVETKRGHYLGRLLTSGSAIPDTGIPGAVNGISEDRLLRAPEDGIWTSDLKIGAEVKKGDAMGSVSGSFVRAPISGVLRGLIRPGINVSKGLKIGDIDPRGEGEHCFTISDKALAIAGGVLEGISRKSGR